MYPTNSYPAAARTVALAGLGTAFSLLSACAIHPDRDVVRQREARLYGSRSTMSPGTASPAPSMEEVQARADLGVYLRYGQHHSAALRQAFERWQAALERIPQVTSLPEPVLSFAQFVEEVQTRTGPQQRRYGLSQTLPWFGKLTRRGEVAQNAADSAWQAVEAARLDVARDIEVAYFDYAYLAQSLRITGESLDLLRQLDPIVQRRIAAGNAGQEDLLKLQVEVGKLENQLASQQSVRAAMSAELAAAMQWPGSEVLPWPDLTAPDIQTLNIDRLLTRANEASPAVLGLKESIARSESSKALADLERWPDLTVGLDYIETDGAAGPVAGRGDDPWALRVMFDLPLARSRYAAAASEAEHELAAARHALTDLRGKLRAKIQRGAFELEDAGRQVALYRETLLPRARESVTVTRASYRAGSASLLDVIDSERARLGFEMAYWRACRDHFQGRARLEALVGGEF